MDGPDYPQDERPGTANNVPSLIHDYRAQRDAWRELARNLARMREEVLTAADREAKDIVSTARGDVRRILLKARRDLLVLAAQVRAAGRLGEAEDSADTITFLPADDLSQARDVLTSARHDVRRVLDESRPELEGLASEGEALRSALRQRPGMPAPAQVRRQLPAVIDEAPVQTLSETPVPFEFTTNGGDSDPDVMLRTRRPVRAFIATAATLGTIAVMGTAWWLYGPLKSKPATAVDATQAVDQGAARATPSSKSAVKTAAATRTASAITPRPGFVALTVAASRSSWVRVTVDGRVAAERIFKPGETQQINSAREVSIRAGDAGAIMVSVDGRPAAALGREGEVVTRRFAAESPRVQPKPPSAPTSAPNPAVPVASTKPQAPAANTSVQQSTASLTPNPATRVADTKPATPPPALTSAPAAASVPAPTQPPPAAALRSPVVERTAPPVTVPAPTATSVQDSLTNAASRWLDAYYRQDRATMAAIAPQANVTDDRADKERLPRGLAGVRRSLDDVKLQMIGTEAMFTARMTERMEAAGQMAEAVSFVSHMWTQKNGSWQLYDVRIVSAAALSRAVTR